MEHGRGESHTGKERKERTGSAAGEGAGHGVRGAVGRGGVECVAEVDEDEVPTPVEHDVVELDVPVEDEALVARLDREEQLPEEPPRDTLRQRAAEKNVVQ